MDSYPETTFIATKQTEIERIVYTSAQVVRGFYFQNKFAVLPKISIKNDSVVVLPDLAYNEVDRYWERVGKYQVNSLTPRVDSNLMSEVSELFDFKALNTKKKDNQWRQMAGTIWTQLIALYPDAKTRISSVEVRITTYGTTCSWGLLNGDGPQKFICYLREDAPVDHIAEALFTVMVRASDDYTVEKWEESEIFVDYLLNTTRLKDVLTQFKPTISSYSGIFLRFKSETELYMSKLGLTFNHPDFSISSEEIMLNGQSIASKFTLGELVILRGLLAKPNTIVGYDELFSCLWGNDVEKHSLWALSRIVSRIRNKIVKLGFMPQTIHAVYGRGYVYVGS